MRLLVSVATPDEAAAAARGGADIVDAKDPRRGALGAVTLSLFRSIVDQVAGRAPVSAAIGDAVDDATAEHDARAFAAAGASFVKLGFAGVREASRVASLIEAAVRGAPRVVAVAYADAARAHGLGPLDVIDVAARAGARGVLLDTADKDEATLRELVDGRELSAWVAHAHRLGLFAAIAGRVALRDIEPLSPCGADIVGVRGAACDGGRLGVVSEERVRALRAQVVNCAAVT